MKTNRQLLFLPALLLPTLALAALPPGVGSDTWYSQTVQRFVDAGYLDAGQPLRPADAVSRAEFVSFVSLMVGGENPDTPARRPFDDVSANDPYFGAFLKGATQQWMMGDKNCLGTHPCTASPKRPINRAEATMLLMRAFKLSGSGSATAFSDVPRGAWFTDSIKGAASRCIIRGDSGKNTVRPAAFMNRVEMLTMLERATQRLTYPVCESATPPVLPTVTSAVSGIASPTSTKTTATVSTTATGGGSGGGSTISTSSPQTNAPSSWASSASSVSSVSSVSSSVSIAPPPSFSNLSSAPASGSDPRFASLLGTYNTYIHRFPAQLASVQSYDTTTAPRLIDILKTEIELLGSLYRYILVAQSRALTADENTLVDATVTNIDAAFANFTIAEQTGHLTSPLPDTNQ